MSDNESIEPNPQAMAGEAAEQLAQVRTNIETTKAEMAMAKGAVEEIQRTTTADAATVTKTKQEIEKLKAETETTATHLTRLCASTGVYMKNTITSSASWSFTPASRKRSKGRVTRNK